MSPTPPSLQVQWLKESRAAVEDFLSREGTVFHSHGFLQSKPGSYCCAVVFRQEQVLAAWPLLLSTKFGVQGFFLPPFAYRYGPVIAAGEDRERLLSLLYSVLPAYSMVLKCPYPLGHSPLWKQWGFRIRSHRSHVLSPGYGPQHLNRRKRQYLAQALKSLEKGQMVETLEDRKPLLRLGYKDARGKPLGSLLCLYDAHHLYHLQPDFPKGSILGILSFYQAALWAKARGLVLDTEGSQIPGVDQFYKQMGGIEFHYAYMERYRGWARILVPLKRALLSVGKAVGLRPPNHKGQGSPY
jgi:hypothetical protein